MAVGQDDGASRSGSEEGVIMYPSGNIAVVVCKEEGGLMLTFFADKSSGSVLASFNHLGEGSVMYESGKPWLIVTSEGYTLSAPSGAVLERSTWPRKSEDTITCAVNNCLTVKFLNKQNIEVIYMGMDAQRRWQCGECFRRTQAMSVTGRRKGKFQLDVPRIKDRQAASGDLYVPPAPKPDLAALTTGTSLLRHKLQRVNAGSEILAAVSGLTALDSRLHLVRSSPPVLYGTSRTSLGLSSSSSSLRGSLGAAAGGVLEDFGRPAMSDTQREFMHTMHSVDYNARAKYRGRRLHLPTLSQPDLVSRVMDAARAPPDTLVAVAVLADWNPVCARLEARLQAVHGTLREEAAAHSSSTSARMELYKYDASQSNFLQTRFGFRSVPMFLMFFCGRLVFAANNLSSPKEVKAALEAALAAGRKAEFLPEGYTFRGVDNTLLDFIHKDMSLRAPR